MLTLRRRRNRPDTNGKYLLKAHFKFKHLLGDLHGNPEKPFAFAAQARARSAVLLRPKLPVLQGIARDARIGPHWKANSSDDEAICLRRPRDRTLDAAVLIYLL